MRLCALGIDGCGDTRKNVHGHFNIALLQLDYRAVATLAAKEFARAIALHRIDAE